MECCSLAGEVKRAVAQGEGERRLAELFAEHGGYIPMREHAKSLERDGVTDLAEIERVLGAHAPSEPVE